jgi:hypothetical protein
MPTFQQPHSPALPFAPAFNPGRGTSVKGRLRPAPCSWCGRSALSAHSIRIIGQVISAPTETHPHRLREWIDGGICGWASGLMRSVRALCAVCGAQYVVCSVQCVCVWGGGVTAGNGNTVRHTHAHTTRTAPGHWHDRIYGQLHRFALGGAQAEEGTLFQSGRRHSRR